MSKLNQAQRDALPRSKFADPENRKFPILDCSDFVDAWNLAGHAENPEAVRRRVLRMGRGLHCSLTPAMEEWRSQNTAQEWAHDEQTESAQLSAMASVAPSGDFEIVAITAGEAIGHGWLFSADVLRRSLALWEGVEIFIDHSARPGSRSLRDLGGVIHSVEWSESLQGVTGHVRTHGPSGALLSALGRELLSDAGPSANVGFSADVLFKANGQQVTQILRVLSCDCVFDPARGGAFLRALNSVSGEGAMSDDEAAAQAAAEKAAAEKAAAEAAAAAAAKPVGVAAQLQADLKAIRELTDVAAEKTRLADEADAARKVRAEMCSLLLEQGLMASKLPKAMVDKIRAQFSGKVFDPSELTAEIESSRELVAQLTASSVVSGITRVHAMFSTEDQLQAAVDDLLEAPRDPKSANLQVHRLTGIRELYHMLTGDYDMHGGYYPERARLATTADFSGLVKNALNKIVVNQWDKLGKAGYDWWTRISQQEHFTSLNQITGTLIGTVGSLPAVLESGEYTELAIGDSPETASFTKYGGYIPLTVELIDRDDARRLKAYPKELANGALRRISGLVAAIFTDNSAVGPTLADGGALFNSTVATTAGGHANLRTTALASAEWEAVKSAVYKQPQLIKNAAGIYGTGPRMAVNPRYLLVPRDLQLTAMQILYPTLEHTAQIYSENQQRGEPGDVITVPEWTDVTDFAAVCDPDILPAIFVGDRFGIKPEIFLAGDDRSPAVFMNDEHRLKVRLFIAVWVNDFRPLHKSNVAG